jgi:hypothetical protein
MADFDPAAFLSDGGDDFDPAAFVGAPASRSDAGPEYGLAFQKVGAPDEPVAPEPSKREQLERLLSSYRAARKSQDDNAQSENTALGVGMATVLPKLAGVRQDLGQLGAALVDKWHGSDKPFGDLVQDSAPQVKKFYDDIESKEPVMTAIGEGIGIPTGAGAAAMGKLATAAKASPFVAKLLAAGGTGLETALASGLLGYRDSKAVGTEGKLYDAASQAVAGGALGTAMPLLPEAIKSIPGAAKEAAGHASQVPKASLDALKRMLTPGFKEPAAPGAAASRADDFASQMDDAARAQASDAVEPAIAGVPEASPAGPYSRADLLEQKAAEKAKAFADAGGTKPAATAPSEGFNVGRMSKADSDRMWVEARAKAKAPNPDYDTGAMKAIDPDIDAMGKGDAPGSKFKSKEDAWRQISSASGDPDLHNQSAKAGHFDEIDRIVGRKVKDTKDAFNALVSQSAKKRGKLRGTHDWEDVNTAIRELRQVPGLENLQLPSHVQDAILPAQEASASFSFGANVQPKAKDPSFLKKSGELADMLGQGADEAAAMKMPREAKGPDPRSKYFTYGEPHEGRTALDRAEQAADLDMGMGGNKPWFSSGQKGLSPEERAALDRMQAKAQPSEAGESVTGNALGGKRAAELNGPVAENTESIPLGEDRKNWLNSHGFDSDGNPLYKDQDVMRIADEVNAQGSTKGGGWYHKSQFGEQAPIDVPGWQGVPPPQPGPTRDAEAARMALGGERLRSVVGAAGKWGGAYGGLKAGGLLGGIGGADIGKRSALATLDKTERASKAMADWGQKILKDPAKLVQLEAQGGQMGKAASFILEGAKSGGESGMAARAFVVSSQPWFRSQFAEQDGD